MICLISCGILEGEVKELIDAGSIEAEPWFLDAGLHCDFDELEEELRRAIGEVQKRSVGAVVVYGDLCHPNIEEIIGEYDNVVKVDALNCIDCLLGGHGELLEIDPDQEYFYLTPGWMPWELRKDEKFSSIFDPASNEVEEKYKQYEGIILIDSLGNLNEFEDEVEEFSRRSDLPVKEVKEVGLDNLRDLILEAIEKLEKS